MIRLGRPGVDIYCQHFGEVAVIQILFLMNEGALVTVCSDDTLHLWNFRQKIPEIVHTLKFQRERITYCHLPFQSKWLYIGTERGNVHIANIESFLLSGYVINWNKAIELLCNNDINVDKRLCNNDINVDKRLCNNDINVDKRLCNNDINVDKRLCNNDINVDKRLCNNDINVDKRLCKNDIIVDKKLCNNDISVEDVCFIQIS
ncbi:hypothetical protein KUTeg_007495 [Tegillarca granosa]|uniref:Uncharacterized protein n=1 Tax=Tegillarca granosa TaxID=220873 RepID=A0ABQ9FI29_TEGGR|nr:hypothetical protein KUTeg_007495 [Tegillarca granosa]